MKHNLPPLQVVVVVFCVTWLELQDQHGHKSEESLASLRLYKFLELASVVRLKLFRFLELLTYFDRYRPRFEGAL
jgi:hypothetical protein